MLFRQSDKAIVVDQSHPVWQKVQQGAGLCVLLQAEDLVFLCHKLQASGPLTSCDKCRDALLQEQQNISMRQTGQSKVECLVVRSLVDGV